MPGTRKLGKPTDQRTAMLRGMVTLLLEKGSIETTLPRAKELRCVADKMITLGKKNTLAARREALAYITKEDVVKKLFDVIAPKYADRVGGYTQVYKLGPRRGDAAEMEIKFALILDRMYKNKLKDGDLDAFTPEQIDEMKAICKERHDYFVNMYEVVNAIGY